MPQRNLPAPGGPIEVPCNGGSVPVTEDATVNIPMLQFESRFECGNLRKAIQVGRLNYNISITLIRVEMLQV